MPTPCPLQRESNCIPLLPWYKGYGKAVSMSSIRLRDAYAMPGAGVYNGGGNGANLGWNGGGIGTDLG
eukprot:1865681-Rhodomonas_salina.1